VMRGIWAAYDRVEDDAQKIEGIGVAKKYREIIKRRMKRVQNDIADHIPLQVRSVDDLLEVIAMLHGITGINHSFMELERRHLNALIGAMRKHVYPAADDAVLATSQPMHSTIRPIPLPEKSSPLIDIASEISEMFKFEETGTKKSKDLMNQVP
jgi:hypothetical protein